MMISKKLHSYYFLVLIITDTSNKILISTNIIEPIEEINASKDVCTENAQKKEKVSKRKLFL